MVAWLTVPAVAVALLLLVTALIFDSLHHRGDSLRGVTRPYLALAISGQFSAAGWVIFSNAHDGTLAVWGARVLAASLLPLSLALDTLIRGLTRRAPIPRRDWIAVGIAVFDLLVLLTPWVVRGPARATDAVTYTAGPHGVGFGPLALPLAMLTGAEILASIGYCLGRGGNPGARPCGLALIAWALIEVNNNLVAIHAYRAPSVPGLGFALFALVVFRAVWLDSRQRELQRESLHAEILGKTREVEAAQTALVDAERLSSLGRIAGSVAHEVNNPVGFILANLEQLRSHVAPRDAVAERALLDSLAGVRRIRQIVSALDAVVRTDEAPVESVRLDQVVDQALLLAGPSVKHGIELVRDLAEVPPFEARKGALMRIVLDLVSHAADDVGSGRSAKITVRTRVERGGAVLELHDNAPTSASDGDSPAQMLRIEVARKSVRAIGGVVLLGERTSEGRSRTVRFPIETTPVEPVRAATTGERKPTKARAKVLLIDDEPALLRVMARILDREHHALTAVNDVAARAVVQSNGDSLDLIVCDVLMGETNGLALRDEIVAMEPALRDRFTFMTGGGLPTDLLERVRATGSPVLEKPIEPDDLTRHVDERLAARRSPRA